MIGLRLAALAFFGIGSIVVAQQGTPAAKPQKVVLVELFTSEGCSSCPPADALLLTLDRMKVEDGTLVVGLSEHVTYWNSLGWRDPFSQDQFTARQNAYGGRFHLDSVYTPQIVVNGERQVLGSDGHAVLAAVAEAGASPVAVSIKALSVQSGKARLTYSVAEAPAGAEVWAVIADDTDRSQVLRGENSGRTLTHAAVARTMISLGAAGAGTKTAEVAIPAAVGSNGGARHVVLFVQGAGAGKVLAVETKEI